jgi:AraC family transcriptional regulator
MSRDARGIDAALVHDRRTLFQSAGVAVIDFRCTAHGHKDGPEEPNPTHSIAIIRRGLFRRTDRGRALVADANHILFFNANQGYQYAHPVAGGDDCTIVTIATPQAVELAERHARRGARITDEQPFRVGHGLASARTARLHYELLRSVGRRLSALAIEDALAELTDATVLAAHAAHGVASAPPLSAAARRRRTELVEETKLAINLRLESPPSLQTLARTFGCSPFHLSRSFHAGAGLSLRRYVSRLRARIAAHYLSGRVSDLTSLALQLGYADHSHFTNAFRAEWGVPPSIFRARHRLY